MKIVEKPVWILRWCSFQKFALSIMSTATPWKMIQCSLIDAFPFDEGDIYPLLPAIRRMNWWITWLDIHWCLSSSFTSSATIRPLNLGEALMINARCDEWSLSLVEPVSEVLSQEWSVLFPTVMKRYPEAVVLCLNWCWIVVAVKSDINHGGVKPMLTHWRWGMVGWLYCTVRVTKHKNTYSK